MRKTVVASIALFLFAATTAQVLVAIAYTSGVSRLISAPSIHERQVRIFARPMHLRRQDPFGQTALIEHLHHIGYCVCQAAPGCYVSDRERVTVWSRYPEWPDVTVRWQGDVVADITTPAGQHLDDATIEPETLLTLSPHEPGEPDRTSHDRIPYEVIAGTPLMDAIVASEDRWFPTHHGLDFPRLAEVLFAGGGASTITMQVARMNVLQDRSRTLDRKFHEIGVAMAMERVHAKAEILTAYANSVYLGVSRGRVVHGFAAAAREYYGQDDVRALTGSEAATLVALLNQPSRYLDRMSAGDDTRLRRQRDRVLELMHVNFPDRYPARWVREMEDQSIAFTQPPIERDDLYAISRYFLDFTAAQWMRPPEERVYLTIDARLQRLAVAAVEQGLTSLDHVTAASPKLQAAFIATNPHTGEVLALVGGRSYEQSQFNRPISARRQVGSIMKPFGYLAAFERAEADGRRDITPETIVIDEPTVFRFRGLKPWTPANYGHHYGGAMTWQRALAQSRNVAAVKVAEIGGFDRLARLWGTASGQFLTSIFPSIALGAIDATAAEVARGYSTFANDGMVPSLRAVSRVAAAGTMFEPPVPPPIRVATAKSARTVANMMRAVFIEGTAQAERDAGLALNAAGKTGTTDSLRDAWFAGFAGDVLAVVWVGRDDGQPVGLTGAQAALPIWTTFMRAALRK